MFRGLLARDLDIPMIGKFVLGRHWRTASEGQRKAYLDTFSKFIVATYAKRLGGIRVDQFDVISAKSLGTKDILVRSRVVNGSKNRFGRTGGCANGKAPSTYLICPSKELAWP